MTALGGALRSGYRKFTLRGREVKERFPKATLGDDLARQIKDDPEGQVPLCDAVAWDEPEQRWHYRVYALKSSGDRQALLHEDTFEKASPRLCFRVGKGRPQDWMGRGPVLAQLPIDLDTRIGGDEGRPVALGDGVMGQAYATLGQVIRQDADSRFTKSSGLGGTTSDLLLAGQLKFNDGIALTARGLLNDSLNFSKAEVRGDWYRDALAVSGSYLWLGTDPNENRITETSEIWFDGSYKVSPSWKASASLRYDISDARATRAGLGLAYSNECVTVDLSVNRRYTSTTSVDPSTDFGFSISMNGFSVNNGSKQYRRSCRQS